MGRGKTNISERAGAVSVDGSKIIFGLGVGGAIALAAFSFVLAMR